MQTLRDLVNNQNVIHSTSNYFNEDSTQKNTYDNAFDNGSTYITGQHNSELNKSTIDQTISQINTAKMIYMVQKSYKEIRELLIKKLDN